MIELAQANWPLFLVALLIGIAVAWFVFNASRRTKVQTDSKDVLDEGASPAQRNQALIDAPPAATPAAVIPVAPPAASGALSGAGTSVAAAAAEAEAKAEPLPVTPAAPVASPASTAHSASDDLSRIKGVGPKLVTMLAEMGVTSFAEIAAWTDADINRVDAQLGRFAGRIRRDDWVRQANLLSGGDMGAYEAAFGKL